MTVVSANDNNITVSSDDNRANINEYYVSLNGSDEEGIGSLESPFLSINRAVDLADDNSRIILNSGTYSGNSNTNIIINKNLTIESQYGDVTINGENKNFFFKINKGSSLTLNNIRFINGYTNSFSQLGVINNQGQLFIANSSFSNMNSLMSTIYNEGNLIIDNTIISNSKSENMAKSITNIGECTICNSKFNEAYENDRDLPTIYNFKNINIFNSQVTYLSSNDNYEPSIFKESIILIENSTMTLINVENAKTRISNSNINMKFSFRNSDVFIENTKVIPPTTQFNTLTIFESNFTAIHSIFATSISSGHTNFNITYSAILYGISGGGDSSYIYAPYNWWGVNSKPPINYFRNIDVKNWAIATFEVEDGNLSVATTSKFITSFKWYDGNNTYDLSENESLPARQVQFESQNGRFLYSRGSLTKSFENYLIENTLDCTVYSTVDNQKLALTIGKGFYAYNYFVAPWGHDGPEDGSLESPFRSLQYAVSKAVDGNTICLLEGTHVGNANSQVVISKNLTIVGLGDVTLLRVNGAIIFNIQEVGNVRISNIHFSAEVREYTDNLFYVRGGTLTIDNCTFHSITSDTIIDSTSGIDNKGSIIIRNSKFSDIKGSIVNGIARVNIQNCSFEEISNFYYRSGLENYNALFTITSSIEIYNSIFRENTMGIITLHPYTYSVSSALHAKIAQSYEGYGRYAYIENTTFLNNVFSGLGSYTSTGIGLDIHDSYSTFNGFINNCTFKGNTGRIAIANSINSSSFYNNHGTDYSGRALIQADLINNSIFIQNINKYVDYNNVSYGEGIASADTILFSTFVGNSASFGGAVSNSREIHYCVFVNNTALYSGNDIYSYSGDVDYSSNWWGDNQKPDENRIFIFLGNLKLTDWIVMSFTSYFENTVEASLNNVIDDDGNIHELSVNIPTRPVYFKIDSGNIAPEFTYLFKNVAYANVSYDLNSSDFKAYAIIDNQILDLNLKNTNTFIIINDVIVKGNENKFYVDLINANGFHLSNQTLYVKITDSKNESNVFTIETDDNGRGSFDIDYPIGKYDVLISYLGNGYYEKSNASAKIEVVALFTKVISYNYSYYGKNNLFYAILQDENGKNLVNYTLKFTITSSSGESRTISSNTNYYGKSEIILNLPIGEYDIKIEYLGDSWYSHSSNSSHIVIKPVNTTIIAPDVTLYGDGNLYRITLKDSYGTLIKGENVIVSISQGNSSDNFVLSTDENGVAGLNINYLPGTYDVKVRYVGDSIYGSSQDSGTITVKQVLTIVSGFHYKIIPVNGIYTVVLSDMYGNRINNGTITLNCYNGKLVKTYSNVTDPNGEALFNIDLDEGSYLTTIDYDGNLWYSEATNAATIVVSKDAVLESVMLNATDLVQYYGENKFFIIEFNDPNAYSQYGKTITVNIFNENWSQSYDIQTDAFGIARLQIKLNPEEYNITYKYSNPHYNIYGSGSNKITIYKMPVTLSANDIIMNINDSRMFSVLVRDINNNPIKNMQINIQINGDECNIATNDKGVASLPLNLNVGEYEIRYSIDNPNYYYASDSKKILVVDSEQTSTQIIAEDMNGYEDNLINFTVRLTDSLNNGISYCEITLEIFDLDGKSVKNLSETSDANGEAIFKFNLENGKYVAIAKYAGNEKYLSSSSTNSISVEMNDNRTKTLIYTDDVVIYTNEEYGIILRDENGIPLPNKYITVNIDDKTYNLKTDDEGKITITIDSNPGIHAINIAFKGDENYKPANSIFKLYVSSTSTKLFAPSLVKYYRNGAQFHALLISGSGKALAGKTIHVNIENTIYNCTTDENGRISLDINFKPGHYNVECYYIDEASQEYIYNKTTIDVLTTIIGKDEVKSYGDSPYLTIKFLNGIGKGINNTNFVINIDGTNYFATTNDEGIFYFDLNLNPGNHIISVTNPHDGLYESYKLTVLPTITVNPLVKVLGDGKYYMATFYDKNNTPLANETVNIIINGINHTYKTDAEGKVKLSMELTPKNYLVTAINTVTGEYVENTIKVLHPISNNKDLIMYFNSGSYFKVRILGANGIPVGAGNIVKFIINGKTYTVKTNKNGYAFIKINLKVNRYIIITQYKKYKVSNKITVKPVLTAKNILKKKVKKVAFNAKLVNNIGKPAAGKKITFLFKNKRYIAKTNSKGIASIRLTLNPGKYVIYSIYGKSKIRNTITIKK